ncbi:MAG: type I DNA topoisomerase [Dehalococcoidia bacterium]|jgi:DNA topoisomerase-1|nr:type I DNA topoisomerase [Dehalococcoidia bacterium]HJN87466.1 type I DNA topoisomerase [Dehalococcoidia bacterium]
MATDSGKKTPARSKPKPKPRTAGTAKKKASPRKSTLRASLTGKHLVIVESPAKARTVGQILGRKYVVTASLGHVRDLPKSKIGVDVDQDFEPSYVIMKDKKTVLTDLKKAGEQATSIYLATDPDREGEAISWHLQAAAEWSRRSEPPKRVVFHEITKEAVMEAFKHPREIDMQLVNAQQARRILDRLVGYQISPLLWRRVQRGLSAGRVQSVALRMVVDREKEIQAFVPVESWTLEAQLHKESGDSTAANLFTAVLHSTKGQKGRLSIAKEDEARRYEAELNGAAYAVASVTKREVRQRPVAPFTTSTLQQDAGRKLRFTAQKTMRIAQQLYEGLSVGPGGPVGLITYMRTDSTQVAGSAVGEVRDYIRDRYGKEFLPDKPRMYTKRSKAAQEAHEAIRPTSARRDPEALRAHLDRDQHNLYKLIWERMVASQMADARSDATTVDIEATCKASPNVYVFRATGSVLKFPGFRSVYAERREENGGAEGRRALPLLVSADPLRCTKLEALQHFTEPPPRFTEGTLIRAMEEQGIGRPSTYAPTIGTLLDRHYVGKEQTRLVPSPLGTTVTELLTEYFTEVMDPEFTARMEKELDDVSRGERQWVPMLDEFYGPFQKALEAAQELMPRRKVEEETDEICETCGMPMVIKTGRFGRFLACTGFPECRTTRRILNKTGASCPKCGGDIVERRSRGRGRPFYGCSRYPECDFLTNRKPVPTPCPECSGLMVIADRDTAACTNCDWQEPMGTDVEEQAPVAG